MKINSKEVNKSDRLRVDLRKIRGISRTISISKIKKISLIRKNWILKGIRFRDSGSNPHSNGEDFSRFWSIFFDIRKFNNINKNEILILNIDKINKEIIYINE